MTVTLELPPDVEVEIATEAAEKGLPLPDYLITVIRSRRSVPLEGVENYLLSGVRPCQRLA